MKTSFLKGCLLLVVLLLIGGGYLFWRARTATVVGEDFQKLTPQQQESRRADARKLEEESAEVARRIRKGDRSPFRLVATEQQLNTLLQDRVRTEKFAIKDLRVGLKSERLTLQGTVPYKGLETTATLIGNVSAQNGKIVFNAESLLLGGLVEAPGEWKTKIESQVTKQLNRLLESNKVRIDRATVEEGELIIEGQPE